MNRSLRLRRLARLAGFSALALGAACEPWSRIGDDRVDADVRSGDDGDGGDAGVRSGGDGGDAGATGDAGGVVVRALSAGIGHTCAVLADGTARCWGPNEWTQLGDGTTTNRATPVAVRGLSGTPQQLTAAFRSTCAVLTDGTAHCWGNSDNGQLGDGTMTDYAGYESAPTSVIGLSLPVTQLVAGPEHTCAALADGTVRCWGTNDYGQLGDGLSTHRSCTGTGTDCSPTSVAVAGLSARVTQLAAGASHTCALLVDGTVRCWGLATSGQLGDGVVMHQTCDDGCDCSPTPVAVTGLGARVTQIAAGGNHTCALLSDGTVQCWGQNDHHELGSEPDIHPACPVSVRANPSWCSLTPVNVPGLSGAVAQLAAGEHHNCVILDDGTVRCWGSDFFGLLGDGQSTDAALPVSVVGLSGAAAQLAAGGDHTCALSREGVVQCWGSNDSGQLGNGTMSMATYATTVAW